MFLRLGSLAMLLPLVVGCQTTDPCGSASGPGGGPQLHVDSPCYCYRLDRLHTGLTARHCAWAALSECHNERGCDFREGFVQAWVDVAHGSCGEAPPVPPERFWCGCWRSPQGHARAQEWYAGYHAGAAQALSSTDARFRQVASSGAGYSRLPQLGSCGDCPYGNSGYSTTGGW